ncbi:MAG: GDP-mannose 4,6-dehydratase [Candidatus Levybacteria bacterium]|nr:GDP-mannose 4,6-dehydratase [Candidatus Levybacteria bacterium]
MRGKETALITGVTGQDGSYLAEFLLGKGYNVVGLVRRTSHLRLDNIRHLASKITLEFGDLIDQSCLEAIVAEHKPNEVYNLAAQSVPADSWRQPVVTEEVTGNGVTRMIDATRKYAPGARFYQASSREIYGGVKNQEVMDEDTPFLPNNPYGIAKLHGHLMVKNARESYGMNARGGILFNHESPRRGLHFVTRKVTMGAAAIKLGIEEPPLNEHGQPLVLDGKLKVGDLTTQRDWGYAKEYVVAMWLMNQQDNPTDYVVATNTIHSVQELCEVAFGCVGLNWTDHVESDQQFKRPTEITASRGNYARIKKDLGWEPNTSFFDLIAIMVDEDMHKLKNGLI